MAVLAVPLHVARRIVLEPPAAILLVARLAHAGGMLGFVPQGRFIGATGTTLVLTAVSLLLILTQLGVAPF